jgi:hypothetical protein
LKDSSILTWRKPSKNFREKFAVAAYILCTRMGLLSKTPAELDGYVYEKFY